MSEARPTFLHKEIQNFHNFDGSSKFKTPLQWRFDVADWIVRIKHRTYRQ